MLNELMAYRKLASFPGRRRNGPASSVSSNSYLIQPVNWSISARDTIFQQIMELSFSWKQLFAVDSTTEVKCEKLWGFRFLSMKAVRYSFYYWSEVWELKLIMGLSFSWKQLLAVDSTTEVK